MKKHILTVILAASTGVLMLPACKQAGNKNASNADSTGTPLVDTTKSMAKDTTGVAKKMVNDYDASFAKEAAEGGMAEVELGTLANEKAANPQVKQFGAMMVADHSKAGDELVGIVKSKNIVLPATLNTPDQDLKAKLSKLSGADFDKAYVSDMVDDHKKDIKTFEEASTKCADTAIRSFAIKTLPTLKMHLSSIEKIQKSMK